MSRLEADRLILKREPFNLREFLSSCNYIASLQARQRQLDFEILTDIDHENLYGDTCRLRQILDNCIQNSMKFTPPGGNISLDVSETGMYGNIAMYRFIITDSGKGMSDEFLGKIFEPFKQEDISSAEKYGGIGLGMYITKNLVDLMEGDIHVGSKSGEGTVVTIHLPFDIVNVRPAINE
jgi:signal transduction histidine kinase